MNCKSLDPLVTPYIDGELTGADRSAVDAHLRACAPCHSRVAAERATHELIRAHKSALEAPRAPDPLRARCHELARTSVVSHQSSVGSPSRQSSWRARLTPMALAASLVIVVGGAFVYQATEVSARVMAAELAADHVKCFAMNRAFGTRQSIAAVESSLASSFGWQGHLPVDADRADLELVGERPCLYGEGRVAHIMYRHRGQPVSLFMLPNASRAEELVEVLGHEAKIWCVGNRTFVLLTRGSRPDVERLAAFVRAGIRD